METKNCTSCLHDKPIEDFPFRSSNGKRYRHSHCRECKNERKKGYNRSKPTSEQYSRYAKTYRNKPENRAQVIITDSRGDDRKKGRENDLDAEFVKAAISEPCSYCGDDDCKKTLDRKDNSIGHVKSNVVVSCERCNLVRANMPYAAWLELCDGMRAAREKGLFGDWHGKFQRK